MDSFETERRTYQRELPRLLAAAGQFVVIRGDDVIGIFPTHDAALDAGYAYCGLVPLLVRQIQEHERPIRGPTRARVAL